MRRHGQTLPIRKSSQPPGSIEKVALGWRMHYPNGDLPSLFQGNQRAKKWDATNEVLRPVDRIDNPPGVRASWLGAELFSQHAIIGEVLPQRLHDDLLASPIRRGDRTLIGFRFNLEGRAEIGEDDLPSRFGSSNSNIEMLL